MSQKVAKKIATRMAVEDEREQIVSNVYQLKMLDLFTLDNICFENITRRSQKIIMLTTWRVGEDINAKNQRNWDFYLYQ